MSSSQWLWSKPQKIKTLLILLLVLVASLITSCASAPQGKPLESLCVLDFEAKVCWFNKSHGEGISFEDMNYCDKGGKCYFALDKKDIMRIYETLNKGN